MPRIELNVESSAGRCGRSASAESLVIAGWTGKDLSSLEQHIRELEELGVPRPATVPVFYRVAANLLSQEGKVEVLGANSSGEAEPVVLAIGGGLWLGIGSDHTDRTVETFSVAASKQVCPKPIGRTVWPLEEVSDHWDRLVLRSFVTIGSSPRALSAGLARPNAFSYGPHQPIHPRGRPSGWNRDVLRNAPGARRITGRTAVRVGTRRSSQAPITSSFVSRDSITDGQLIYGNRYIGERMSAGHSIVSRKPLPKAARRPRSSGATKATRTAEPGHKSWQSRRMRQSSFESSRWTIGRDLM